MTSGAATEAIGAHRRNVASFLTGETIWALGVATVAPATVLVAWLREHGGSAGTAGIIGAIDGGGALLQVAGPWLFRSHRQRKRQILWWYGLTSLPALGVMAALASGAVALPPATVRLAMLAAYALFAASLGAAIGVWMDWYGHLFDERMRAGLCGLTRCGQAVAGIVGGSAAGWMLAALPATTAYASLYLLALVWCGVSLFAYGLVRDPAEAESADVVPPRGAALLALIAASLRDRVVRAFLLGRVLGNAALATTPFLALRFLDQGLPARTVVSSAIAFSVGAAIAAFVCGRIGDRRGHRGSLVTGMGLAAIALVGALAAPGVAGCLGCYLTLGLASGAWSAGSYLAYETVPHGSRLAHLLAVNLIQAGSGLIVPIAWAGLADRFGIGWVFAAGLAAVVAALAWMLAAVPEPRAARPPARPIASDAEARRAA